MPPASAFGSLSLKSPTYGPSELNLNFSLFDIYIED
jgi:hypothetical protein